MQSGEIPFLKQYEKFPEGDTICYIVKEGEEMELLEFIKKQISYYENSMLQFVYDKDVDWLDDVIGAFQKFGFDLYKGRYVLQLIIYKT